MVTDCEHLNDSIYSSNEGLCRSPSDEWLSRLQDSGKPIPHVAYMLLGPSGDQVLLGTGIFGGASERYLKNS